MNASSAGTLLLSSQQIRYLLDELHVEVFAADQGEKAEGGLLLEDAARRRHGDEGVQHARRPVGRLVTFFVRAQTFLKETIFPGTVDVRRPPMWRLFETEEIAREHGTQRVNLTTIPLFPFASVYHLDVQAALQNREDGVDPLVLHKSAERPPRAVLLLLPQQPERATTRCSAR